MAFKVFLSFAESDRGVVELLAQHAKLHGIEVYTYDRDMKPGTSVAEKLRNALSQADALVVILTSGSHGSPYVQQEIGAALMAKKPVIPLVELEPGKKLAMLEGLEYIRLDTKQPDPAVLNVLRVLTDMKKQKTTNAVVGWAAVGAIAYFLTRKDEE